jgi:5-methylcytosine-specific restriction endonuclease McrA
MHPGCNATYDGQGAYCPLHKPLHDADKTYTRYNRDKGRQVFESSSRWRKIRHAYLAHYPLCQDCQAKGIIKTAEQVHHIDNDYNNNYDTNLMGLCISCHSIRTRRGE